MGYRDDRCGFKLRPLVAALAQHLARGHRICFHGARYPKAARLAALAAAHAVPPATPSHGRGHTGSLWRTAYSFWSIDSAGGAHSCRGDGSGILHGPCTAQFLATGEQGRERCALLLYLPIPSRGGRRSLEHRSVVEKGLRLRAPSSDCQRCAVIMRSILLD